MRAVSAEHPVPHWFQLRRTASVLLALSLFAGAAVSQSPSFSIRLLERPVGFQTVPFDLNSGGEAVGYYLDESLNYRAILWTAAGVPVDLADPGSWSQAHALADDGTVAGYYGMSLASVQPAVWNEDGVSLLSVPADVIGGSVEAVTSSGSAVGSITQSSSRSAALWMSGNFRSLGISSTVTDLSERGIAVGHTLVDGFPRAALWRRARGPRILPSSGDSIARAVSSNHRITGAISNDEAGASSPVVWDSPSASPRFLPAFAGQTGTASDINAAGWAVGTSSLDPYNLDGQALLWLDDGSVHDLNSLIPAETGWDLISAVAVNDAGQILGFGTLTGSTGQVAFLLSPN